VEWFNVALEAKVLLSAQQGSIAPVSRKASRYSFGGRSLSWISEKISLPFAGGSKSWKDWASSKLRQPEVVDVFQSLVFCPNNRLIRGCCLPEGKALFVGKSLSSVGS
jgi:hypothetical protein